MRVGLVFGGETTEGEVSKQSALGVRGALQKLGYEFVDIEFDKNIALHIQDASVDVVFNAMHGQYGEDGRLQGVLDILQIPYTHSGLLASALCMNKIATNEVFNILGVPTIQGIVVSKTDLHNDIWKDIVKKSALADRKELFIKPVCDGSSRDTFLVHNVDEYSFKTTNFTTASEYFLIEERIIGREIQVAVVDDKAVGLLEVVPNKDISEYYDYIAKYSENGAEHKLFEGSEGVKNRLLEIANNVHRKLKLNCVSRFEFLLDNNDAIYALEINTHPGLTALSIVPEIARNNGISYEELVDKLLKTARFGL